MTPRSAAPLDRPTPAERLAAELTRQRMTLTLAESCTGGLIAKQLTDLPGASAFLIAGIVAYANQAKEQFLGVRRETLELHGAVSEAVAREMALGAQRVTGTDAALAVTGIAGPGGGTEAKPVGTVWIAAAVGVETRAAHFRFSGGRRSVRERAAEAAVLLLLELLQDTEDGPWPEDA